MGRVLLAKQQTTRDSTDAAKPDQGRAAEGPRPLSTDVVRLVRHARGDIRIAPGHGQEHARVAGDIALRKSHHRQPDDAQQGIRDEERPSHVEPVTHPGAGVHDNAGQHVGWGDETLRGAHPEAQAFHEDDGEEVGDCVGDCSQTEEDQSEAPDLHVQCGRQEPLERERLDVAVVAVVVDAAHDKVAFLAVEEAPGTGGAVGEVD